MKRRFCRIVCLAHSMSISTEIFARKALIYIQACHICLNYEIFALRLDNNPFAFIDGGMLHSEPAPCTQIRA